jgi:solute:Na+ symporter, SSS family
VQRYLTARSEDEARHSLLMSAYWKIPLQVVVLVLGILVFAFYIFTPPPLLFSSVAEQRLRSGPAAAQYAELESQHTTALAVRRQAALEVAAARDADDPARLSAAQEAMRQSEAGVQSVWTSARTLVRESGGDAAFTDVNYIIPTFILTQLPIGLVGLLIVAIIMAATDTIAGELNSLATATVIDFYRRWFKRAATDTHYLNVSKAATGLWGLFACAVAVWAAELGSLIEVVNRFGSYFYGSILGVFILAIGFPRATATGAFVGLIAGMATVGAAATFTNVAFLWHNVTGAVAVVVVGMALSLLSRPAERTT